MADTKTAQDVLDLISREGVQMVDYRIQDLPGVWQHFSVPAGEVDAGVFEEGVGFDGSSGQRRKY